MAVYSFHISVEEAGWKKILPGYKRLIATALAVIKKHCKLKGEVSILLTNDKSIKKLNKAYRGKDKPTNVLSFPQNEPGLLGDVIMALETLETEAQEQEKSFADHFTHLFVHGVLHLLGHDHIETAQQTAMEMLEISILMHLNIENPYI